jgi:hypothetical protein
MGHFTNAEQLLQHAKEQYTVINKHYQSSLLEKNINQGLLIEIKNFMENLRSALDYTIHGLFEKYGDKSYNKKLYFPYAKIGNNEVDFKKRVEKMFPDNSKIIDVLTSHQVFVSSKNAWLPKFMDINNENKHQFLTPQIRKETRQINISSGKVSIGIGEGASIQMGANTMIQIGNAIIPGGQTIDVNNPAKIFGNDVKQEVIIWISFHFSTNNEPVLPLLEDSLKGISEIVILPGQYYAIIL